MAETDTAPFDVPDEAFLALPLDAPQRFLRHLG